MAKFQKQQFFSKKENQFKTFSYTIAIPKLIVEQANLEIGKVDFKVENDKIIIQKSIDKQ